MHTQNSILVSICCTTYNHEQFIKECLNGFVKQQTNFPFEILVHEDASTDNTARIVKEYENKYPNLFRCVYQTENQFLKQNTLINILFPMARGKYIAMCEGDDYWTDPNKLQKQVDFLEANPDYAICFNAVNTLSGTTEKPSVLNRSKEETYSILDLAEENIIHTASVVFRNGLFEKFPDWFNESPAGDYVLHMLNAKKGLIKYFPETMAVYRVHNAGVWGQHNVEVNHPKWLWLLNKLQAEDFSENVLKKISAQKNKVFVEYSEVLFQRKQYDLIKDAWHKFYKQDENFDLLMDLFITKINDLDQAINGIKNRKVYKAGQKLSDLRYKYSNLLNKKHDNL